MAFEEERKPVGTKSVDVCLSCGWWGPVTTYPRIEPDGPTVDFCVVCANTRGAGSRIDDFCETVAVTTHHILSRLVPDYEYMPDAPD